MSCGYALIDGLCVSQGRTNSLEHLVGGLEVGDEHAHLVIVGRPGQERAHLPLHALHRGVCSSLSVVVERMKEEDAIAEKKKSDVSIVRVLQMECHKAGLSLVNNFPRCCTRVFLGAAQERSSLDSVLLDRRPPIPPVF